MFDAPIVFVDIETDGLSAANGHVIEVAAIRVEHGSITREFRSLIDPGVPIPYFITNLTSINDRDVARAPSFRDISDELAAVMNGAIFIAHNVQFDYSFLREEFKRVGIVFSPRLFCTVKLSKALYPEYRTHKLADLIQRHDFTFTDRHRAYDDAHVLWQFLEHVRGAFSHEHITRAVQKQLPAVAA